MEIVYIVVGYAASADGIRRMPATVGDMMVFELFDPDAEYVVGERCNLPHWYQPGVTYFVAYRTEDSIPADVARHWRQRRDEWLRRHGIEPRAQNWKGELSRLVRHEQRDFHETFSREFLEQLDRGHGDCVLKQKELSQIVADNLRYFDGQRYHIGDFVVMPNHYHLLYQTPRANLSDSAGWLQTTYAVRFNRRHARSGHLFRGRFKAYLVEADSYARQLIQYIHLNRVRPRDKRRPVPVKRRGELSRYRWSSHRVYAGLSSVSSPNWFCTEWLSYFGRTYDMACREYRAQIAAMFGQVVRSPWQDLRGGLLLGSERLWNKVCGLVAQSDGDDEIRWSQRAGAEAISAEIERLAAAQSDRRIAIWLHVRHGGRRMTEKARRFGYRDGGGVHRVVKRLEARATEDPQLARTLRSLVDSLSRVKEARRNAGLGRTWRMG